MGEDCEAILMKFIRAEMTVKVVSFDCDRVHEVGVKRVGNNRPMAAKFHPFKKKEEVRNAGPALKGKIIGVSEQLPREIACGEEETVMPSDKTCHE